MNTYDQADGPKPGGRANTLARVAHLFTLGDAMRFL
jgi:hypothetical protein